MLTEVDDALPTACPGAGGRDVLRYATAVASIVLAVWLYGQAIHS